MAARCGGSREPASMRPPILRISYDELIVDSFAGGGGASLGIEMALGRSPDIAINHDGEALAMHQVNHPTSRHLCEDVWAVDPVEACGGRKVGLMWLSPDCKHFSKAKGGKPVEKKIRGLAWVAVKWAKAVKPRVIVLENVEEFEDWGPLLDDGMPCKLRKGLTFRRFKRQLEKCGYKVEVTKLVAADYGAPTTRKRLFLIARSDGLAITWPKPTHGKGRALPWRTAAECIDWFHPCPSIFERVRPLADNTLRRIARGIRKYVIDAAVPFIVPLTHHGERRVHPMGEPMPTVTGAHRGEHALITPVISAFYGDKGASSDRCQDMRKPLPTQTADPRFALVAPILSSQAPIENQAADFRMLRSQFSEEQRDPGLFPEIAGDFQIPTMIQTGYGEREGQSPRVPGLDKPLGTVVGGGQKHALVAAFMAQHNGGFYDKRGGAGNSAGKPLSTICHRATQQQLVASSLVKLKGTSKDGQSLMFPLHTVQAGGLHYAEVRAFLLKFYGTDQDPRLEEPMHTVTSKDRFGLVTVAGEEYAIADIGMRMLQPRELFRAQGFHDGYIIDADASGKPFTKSAQVRMCGNSVCPPVAAAIIAANLGAQVAEAVA